MQTTTLNNENEWTTGSQSQANVQQQNQQAGPGDTTEEQKVVNSQDDEIVNGGDDEEMQQQSDDSTAKDSWGKDKDGVQKEQPEFVENDDDDLPDPIDDNPEKTIKEAPKM